MATDVQASMVLDRAYIIDRVDDRLFGSFIEHLGRAVYQGIYQPGHPTADARGFRTDVLALVRELGVPVVRYPGGNFVSGYDWEDGLGPQSQRPRRLEPAWQSIETNQFGLDEFLAWAEAAGCAPMLAVNLGTRGLEAARNQLEYCNFPGGTLWSDRRIANGHAAPYGAKLWCLGNEMDGPWQIGHKSALEYGRLAAETGHLMKLIDPTIELVVCGSSHSGMPTYPQWEATVLEEAYAQVDYLSMHHYFGNYNGNARDFWGIALEMDRFIRTLVSTCDYVKAKVRGRKDIHLSFDEWNVWYKNHEAQGGWAEAPCLLEEIYNLEDAIMVGGALITLLNHCDRVKIACLAQLVNVIAPIMTDDAGVWRQTIYYPFLHAARYGRGTVLRPAISSPTYTADAGDVPVLDAAVVLGEDARALTVFAVNRELDGPLTLTADLRGFTEAYRLTEAVTLTDADLHAHNSAAAPFRVAPRANPEVTIADGRLSARLPAQSWNMIRLTAGG